MKNKNQTVFEDSDQEETSTQKTNGKNGTANGNDQQTGDFKNFDLSKKTVKKLKARNVEYLYSVQSKSYKSIYEQNDCLIQAPTGSGKTLAYALPLVELLQSDKTFELAEGRSARVLVLSSTKDTVKQVSDEFQTLVNDLSVVPAYSAKKKSDEQEAAIANGVDVLVATPDRTKELLDNEKIDLSSVNHVVIDDADQMVESEASESVKKVLKQVFSSDRENKAQLVVLSQTSSDSFRKLVKKYLSDDAVTINSAAGSTGASADDENDEGFDESANNTSANGALSLLTKKENYTTYQLTTNEEIKSVGFVYSIIRKCLGDTFDAKSSIPQIAFTKDFTSAVFDVPSELNEQLQNAWKDTNRTQLGPITQLPEIDQSSITDNTGYSRGAGGGNRNAGKSSNGCFKCGKEGHKSFECSEGGGPQRGGGNRAGGNACFNCGKDGHKSFECTEPKKAGGGGGGGRSNGCFNCGQEGHRSYECTEPKKAGGGGGAGGRSNGCFNCGQEGHRSFECTEPKKAGGGGGAGGRSNGCFNCGQEGHRSFECTEPKKAGGGGGGGAGGCFNCGKDGHKSFECPEPKKGRPSAGGARGGGRGGARGGGPKRSFGGGYDNGNSAGEVTNKKIKFDDDE